MNPFENSNHFASNNFSSSGYQNPFTLNQNAQSLIQLTNQYNPLINQQTNFIQKPIQEEHFSQESPDQQIFLKEIQEYLVTHNKKLNEALNEIGVQPASTHITKSNLDALGRQARAQLLDERTLTDLFFKLEDKTMPNHIQITLLEQKLNSFGFFFEKRIETNQQKDRIIQNIKQHMEKLKISKVEQLFVNNQTVANEKLIDFQEFVKLIISESKDISIQDAEIVAKLYESSRHMGKISIDKLQQDIELTQNTMSTEKANEILNQIFDHIKKFAATNSRNVVDVFMDSDINDGYIDRTEMKDALEQFGVPSVNDDHIQAVFLIFDSQGSNKTDYKQILDKFFQYANKNQIIDTKHKFFNIYDTIRKYMKSKKIVSVSQLFSGSIRKDMDIPTDDFFSFIKKIIGVKFNNAVQEQSFGLSLFSSSDSSKIDFFKFADNIGYDYPQKAANIDNQRRNFGDSQGFVKGFFKTEQKRNFFRTLLKDLHNRNGLESDLRETDTNLTQFIHINTFGNVLFRHCNKLLQNPDQIEFISKEYQKSHQEPFLINYELFIEKMRLETKKLNFLEKIYKTFYETLQFKAIQDLYTLFLSFDFRKDKKFNADQLKKIFDKRGITLSSQELDFLFEEYDLDQKKECVNYSEIEKDYRLFIEEEKKKGFVYNEANLPYILQTLKRYTELTGQTLRQIFNKNNVGDPDQIKQYDFNKIINNISQETRSHISQPAIHKFMLELSTSDNTSVSFSELLKLFNSHFNIQNIEDDQEFRNYYIDQLQWHIVKISMDKKPYNFLLQDHFQYPSSDYSQFMLDLRKEPLNCHIKHRQQVMDQMTQKYSRGSYVDTQHFIQDIQEKIVKYEQKLGLLNDLRKQIMLKNLTIEEVFKTAITNIQKFSIEHLSAEEFQRVFLFAEYNIPLQKVKDLLYTFFVPNDKGQYSYLQFIEEYKSIEKTNSQVRGRRQYANLNDILRRIGQMIEARGLKTFGTLLADQDLKGVGSIEQDSFYRTLDSLQFGLGEGDIQELIRIFKKGNQVDIQKFRDEVNPYINNLDFKITLKSLLNQVVQERIVDQVELSPRQGKNIDQQHLQKFMKLIKDIMCGLYIRGTDAQQWFTKYSSFVKGSLTNKEFIQATEGLNVFEDINLKQQYYDNLVIRQEEQLGYKSQILLIEKFNYLIYKDCSSNRYELIEDIIYDIALSLTQQKLPIQDIFLNFDTNRTGQIYRNDFIASFLDNYLRLSTTLTINMKQLLVTKYVPTESTISFAYELFLQDLKNQMLQHPRNIKIYMTQYDIDMEKSQINQHDNLGSFGSPHYNQQMPHVTQDPVANTKKNTVVTEFTCKNNMKVQIPSFQFDEIMTETYRRGVAVEVYFKAFSNFQNGEFQVSKDQFSQAIIGLGVRWADNIRLSEMFDALDMSSHGTIYRYISTQNIGEAVLQNALYTIEYYQAKAIEVIYNALKKKQFLGKLRDLFNFYNTRRDSTCAAKDFKQIFLEKLEMSKIISDSQLELLIFRYKTMNDASRISFTQFIKDMEYCDAGVQSTLIWAIDFVEDMGKGIIVQNLTSPEQLFQKYSKIQGIITYDEFRRAIDELQISIYHEEEEQREFFNHVEMQQNQDTRQGTQASNYSKVSLQQLVNIIRKLSLSKLISFIHTLIENIGQIYQDILERIYAEIKKNNITVTVFTIFTDLDPQKSGHVSFQDFKYAIEEKLKIQNIKLLDLQVLSKRYKSNQRNVPDGMIQYEKFFQDFEKLEQYGLRAGFDPLKNKQMQESMIRNQPQKQVSPDAKALYDKMRGYCQQQNIDDLLCESLVRADTSRRGQLTYQQILEVYRQHKITLNTKQMNLIIEPLPVDTLDTSYNYLVMIDMLFGSKKQQEIMAKYKLLGQHMETTGNYQGGYQEQKPLVMSERFKDQIEVKFQMIQSIGHQLSKGSYLVREIELTNLFKKCGITLLSQDLDLIQSVFTQMKNNQTKALDLRQFIKYFNISEQSSIILMEIQKQISLKNIKIEEALLIQENLALNDFKTFITSQNIDLSHFKEYEISHFFNQIAERKEKIDKYQFIRILKNEGDIQDQEWLPYIANELIYYIVNNNINLFQFVNPQAKKLTYQQFQSLLAQIKFKPTDPKDMPTLLNFFAIQNDPQCISIEKLIEQIRKLDSTYGGGAKKPQQTKPINQLKPELEKKQPSKQLSQFSQKMKGVLQKINDQLKRNGINNKKLFDMIDVNKNGLVEKQEFIQYFNKEFQVQGLTQADFESLFDALDMNKDGYLSLSEFCLCLEGIQLSMDQKMKSFDIDLEKSMKEQINELFNFFDTNKDGSITLEELQFALRSINPSLGLKEAQEIMKEVDKNRSGTIDRQEFQNMMLPKFKEEMLMYEQNLDDLRRLFKEADTDQSNYLNKDELIKALAKMNIELTDVQMEDLMKELDVDGNQVIDIDEFIAFLTIADQVKFKNPQSKTTLVKIRQARKLQPMDFYNCFKNLPQFFTPSFTQECLERKYIHTPSWGIYPEYDSKTMTYKDLKKLDDVTKVPAKKFIDLYPPLTACEIQIEEANAVPMPRKEDFDWNKISHREIRCVLIDFRTKEYLSNMFILGASWKTDYQGKWLFNTTESQLQAKNFILKTDLTGKVLAENELSRDIHLLFELIIFSNTQQISCAWASIPINQLDKAAKLKIALKGGNPFFEMRIDQAEIHQEKKGFAFLKKIAAPSDEPQLILNIKTYQGMNEQTKHYISMLPQTCIVSKRLLSFVAAFRVYCFRKLNKAQQLMVAPQGNFVIAQFKKIYDNPDVNFILGDVWDQEIAQKQVKDLETIIAKMETFMTQLYAIIYSAEFKFDHVYPTRSSPLDSDKFYNREILIKSSLLLGKFKSVKDQMKGKKKEESKQAETLNMESFEDDYKPFNVAEMEIPICGLDSLESKQDELIKMYQQMGLIY